MNTKYGQNAGGAVYWRLPDASNFTWHDTGYNATLAKALKISSAAVNAPMGIFAGVDGNTPYIVVMTQGADVWRAIPAESTMQQPWTWTQLATGIGTAGNIAQHCPIIGDQAGNLYCFDRVQGLYRSTDHGKAHTWTQIWDITTAKPPVSVSDERSGWLALKPHADGELWLSASTGLYKLTSADTGASVGNGIGLITFASPFPNGAGGIAFTSTGQPYVPALSGPLPTASPLTSATLQTTTDGSMWQDAADDSFGSYASWPKCAALAATTTGQTIIMVASDSNWAIYGTPTT